MILLNGVDHSHRVFLKSHMIDYQISYHIKLILILGRNNIMLKLSGGISLNPLIIDPLNPVSISRNFNKLNKGVGAMKTWC